LPTALVEDDERAKRLDLLVLRRELAQLEGDAAAAKRTREAIQELAAELAAKANLPQIKPHLAFLDEVAGDEWWDGVTLAMLEQARHVLRTLVQFIERRRRHAVLVDWEDSLGEGKSVELPLVTAGVDVARFRDKVTAYIRGHQDHLAIQRLRRGLPLTALDLKSLEDILIEQGEGTPEALRRVTGERGLGLFVRSLVGLDRSAAEQLIETKLAGGEHTASQVNFLRMVVDELVGRGVMEPRRLFESPYADSAATRLELVFPAEADQRLIVEALRDIEASAVPAA
jgi:type I restriction enzyme R subunit